jgi:ketosteroid isomerase-like protein
MQVMTDQAIRDEFEIRRLVASYCDAVTHLDAVRAASGYAEDGSVSIVGAELFGREAIEQGMRDSFSHFSILQMIAHAGLIEADGDRAKARWSTVELTVRRDSTDLNCIFGCYEDDLVRLAEGWRFKRRVFSMAGRTLLEGKKVQLNSAFGGALQFRL